MIKLKLVKYLLFFLLFIGCSQRNSNNHLKEVLVDTLSRQSFRNNFTVIGGDTFFTYRDDTLNFTKIDSFGFTNIDSLRIEQIDSIATKDRLVKIPAVNKLIQKLINLENLYAVPPKNTEYYLIIEGPIKPTQKEFINPFQKKVAYVQKAELDSVSSGGTIRILNIKISLDKMYFIARIQYLSSIMKNPVQGNDVVLKYDSNKKDWILIKLNELWY
jgi:hypothetical protein